LKDLAAAGVSILISSHILAELESLCKSILLLNWGRILASGSQKEIRSDIRNWSEELEIECDSPEMLLRRLFDAGVLAGFDLDPENGRLRIRVRDAASFYEQWTGLLLASGAAIYGLRGRSRSLQNIYDKVTA
jgi:ABC-2 type transport system ATP-binding protein